MHQHHKVFLTAAALAYGVPAPAQLAWTNAMPTAPPSPRSSHAIAYDAGRDRIVITGGWDGSADLDEVWEFDGSAWRQRSPTGGPGIHSSHALAYDAQRGTVVLFGDWNAGAGRAETWEWDGGSGRWTDRTPATGPSPSPRFAHRMVYDASRGRVVLFGGDCTNGCIAGDTWEWDGSAGTWTQRTPANSPGPRYSAGMAYDLHRGVVVLYGGRDARGQLADTWEWDGGAGTWTQSTPATAPGPRSTHGMAYDAGRRRTVMFGGWDGGRWRGDVWDWSGTTWRRRAAGVAPAARGWPTLAYDGLRRRTVSFGGYDGRTPLGDTWWLAPVNPAAVRAYGLACPGALGPPQLTPTGALPWLGDTLTLQVDAVPAGAPVVAALGSSATTWAGGPLPLSLTPIGMTGCSLWTSAEWNAALPVATGPSIPWQLPIPINPSLLGASTFGQAFVLDAGANPAGASATGGLQLTIGAR